MNIKKIEFPEQHFIKQETKKNTIVLHHSAGWDNARGMFVWWMNDQYQKVCTHYGVEDNGIIYQGLDSKYWGYALRVAAKGNIIPAKFKTIEQDTLLNKQAIQIEICNWGALTQQNGRLFTWTGLELPKQKAVFYENAFRGFHWFERYTDAEIQALKDLIIFHHHEDDIPLSYNKDMWDISTEALSGKAGIWTHSSYRSDKSDCHPQPELIQMLQELSLK